MSLVLPIVLVILVLAVAAWWYFSRRKAGSAPAGSPETRVDPVMNAQGVSLKELRESIAKDAGEEAKEPEAAAPAPEEAKAEAPAPEPEPAPAPAPHEAEPKDAASGEAVCTELPDVDQMTEVVVRLTCKTPFSTNQALLASQPLRSQDFGAPLRIQVKNQFTRLWGPIQRGATYTEMIASLQLATRAAALDDLAAANFAAAVNHAVATLDADADVVDVPSVVAQAKAVKELIDRYSIRLSVGVKGPLPVTEQAAMELADRCGFTVNGRSVEKREADSSSPWLRMMPHPEHPNMVVLELMPALCTPSQNPLGQLFAVANDIAARVSGQITDANGTPLAAPQIVAITRQIKFFYAAMARQGLDPGTRRAKRLFA